MYNIYIAYLKSFPFFSFFITEIRHISITFCLIFYNMFFSFRVIFRCTKIILCVSKLFLLFAKNQLGLACARHTLNKTNLHTLNKTNLTAKETKKSSLCESESSQYFSKYNSIEKSTERYGTYRADHRLSDPH